MCSSDLIPGLFPTGVDDSVTGLPSGAPDPHYAILDPAQDAITIDPGSGSWIRNTTHDRWVWQMANGTPVNVTRTFRITFSLAGLIPSTASISGTWASDNLGVGIALNGHDLGMPTTNQFRAFTPFTIPAGTPQFVPGINTLDFTVTDQGLVAGLLVGSLSGTAEPIAAP